MSQSIKNSRRRKIIAAVLILSLLGATPGYAFLRTSQARAGEMQAYTSAKAAQSDLQSTQDALTALSQNSENDTIAAQISTNNEILASEISTRDAGPFDYEIHEASASRLQTVSETISTAEQSSRAIAADILQEHIDALQQAIDANRDQVEDPSNIDKATDDINHAQSLIINASCPLSDISDAADTLAADCQAINESHANWVIQKDREAALTRSSAAYVADITNDTWDAGTTVWYTGIYPPHGASQVYEWRTNYFIAHSTDAAGKAIAAHYAHVIVNGKSYHYCATINVNKHTGTPSDVLPFGTDDGGIAFQTCNNDGTTVQVNRYDAD